MNIIEIAGKLDSLLKEKYGMELDIREVGVDLPNHRMWISSYEGYEPDISAEGLTSGLKQGIVVWNFHRSILSFPEESGNCRHIQLPTGVYDSFNNSIVNCTKNYPNYSYFYLNSTGITGR